MGKRKSIIVVLFLLFVLVVFTQCITNRRKHDTKFGAIEDILLTENTMIINFSMIRGKNESFNSGLNIKYKNIRKKSGNNGYLYLYTRTVVEKWEEIDSLYWFMGTITADLTNIPRAVFTKSEGFKEKTFYVNEEAEITISGKGRICYIEVFIGEDRVEILRQGFLILGLDYFR